MKLLNIENYEIGNGIAVTILYRNQEIDLYMQLPQSPDSVHHFLNTNDVSDDEKGEVMEQAAELVQTFYTAEQLNVLTELGTLDYTITDDFNKNGDRIYHVIDNGDSDNYIDLIECAVSSYYNVFLLQPYN